MILHKAYVPALFLLVAIFGDSPTSSGQTPLTSFQREAESALKRSIVITELEDISPNLGLTYCDLNPVVIKITKGIAADLREQVLSHELGHALLCGRNILSVTRSKQRPPFKGTGLVANIGAVIGSCYIDPLADEEAEKRGFKPSQINDELYRNGKTHTKEDFRASVTRFGEFAADFTALAVYCSQLRPHSVQVADAEQPYAAEPTILSKLKVLRQLGEPKCHDSISCHDLTERLRAALKLEDYVEIQNPATSLYE
jgi:hypothetical protein